MENTRIIKANNPQPMYISLRSCCPLVDRKKNNIRLIFSTPLYVITSFKCRFSVQTVFCVKCCREYVSMNVMPYPNTSFCFLRPPLPTGACTLDAKQKGNVVSKTDSQITQDANKTHDSQLLAVLRSMLISEKACHTGPFLLSPSLTVRLMSTSTTPMSSSRLLGSSRGRASSFTLMFKDRNGSS